MKEIHITDKNYGQRIDKMMLKLLPGMSKSLCYKMFRKKNIVLNDKKIKGNELLQKGDNIKVYFSEETFIKFSGTHTTHIKQGRFTLNEDHILYNDAQLLVVNKEVGWLSQGAGNESSLIEAIEDYYRRNNGSLEEGVSVSVSNRLDKNTSGVILSGKTLPIIKGLNQLIMEHKVDKVYKTIVVGKLLEEQIIEGYVYKDEKNNTVKFYEMDKSLESKRGYDYIYTAIKPICIGDNYTELEVVIKTGKSHQIRVSLAANGHPIIGDMKYGNVKVNKALQQQFDLTHQLLHAWKYKLKDTSGLLKHYKAPFVAPLPEQYKAIRNELF